MHAGTRSTCLNPLNEEIDESSKQPESIKVCSPSADQGTDGMELCTAIWVLPVLMIQVSHTCLFYNDHRAQQLRPWHPAEEAGTETQLLRRCRHTCKQQAHTKCQTCHLNH